MEKVNNKDLLVMKLIHYFMVKKDYVPIIIRGIENEVWLENPKGEFRIIRIVTKNIFNNEQYEFDSFKTKNIVTQIMKQTFNPFIDVLTIYTEIGDNFKKNIVNTKKYKYITIEKEEDIKNNELLNKHYKDMKDSLMEDDDNLLSKITMDISDKNIKDSERFSKDMSKRDNKPMLSYILIAINIIIFVLMYTVGNGANNLDGALIKFGANYVALTKVGQYFRLITSAFLHIGIIHLLCNMYSLFEIGPTIEYFFGKAKFLIIYFYSALTASLFVLIFQSSNSLAAGASGAIFGLLGALLYFGYTYRGYIGNQIMSRVVSVVLLNLAIGFTLRGISNAAHIGGFIGGIAISYMLGANTSEKKNYIGGSFIVVVLTAFLIYMSFFR